MTATPLSDAEEDEEPDTLVQTKYDPITRQRTVSFSGEHNRFSIRRVPQALNDTPYWIMKVPRSLIPDHSTIFSFNTLRLLRAIMDLTGALEEDASTTLVQDRGVRPVKLATAGSGDLVFVDSSRRLYRVPVGGGSPIFSQCTPQFADPATNAGVVLQGDSGLVVTSQRASQGPSERHETRLAEFRLQHGRLEIESVRRIRGSRRYTSAAFDMAGGKVYLSPGQPAEVYVANLRLKKLDPELWFRLEGAETISALHFDESSGFLYATDGVAGDLYRTAAGTTPTLPHPSIQRPTPLTGSET